MNIRKTIITATVALTMVAMIAPMTAGAMTAAEMQAQINALQAQLNALNNVSTTGMPAACVGVTFVRNLVIGSIGSDVRCLQVILNMSASTRVAISGAGSPGNETSYFGGLTLAAVKTWQAQQGWTPANQVGPLSRAKLNQWLANATTVVVLPPVPVPPGLPAGCTSTTGYSPVNGVSCATGTVVQTGPISASLSASTPAAGFIVGGQATADLLHVTFTGSGTVTSVTLNRSGISDQNTLTNVYLYDGNVRLTDGYSFNINSQIVMNGLSIAVNGSREISVRADVAATAPTTASSLAVAVTGYTANGASSTANIIGNTMSIAVGNLASVVMSANTVFAANVNAGTTGYTFWSAPIQVNTRAVWLKGANFRMIGSAPSDALANIRLFVDGVDTGKVATVVMIQGSNYAMFDLTSAPINLMTGSHTVDVRANVEKGSNRTVQLSLQQAADLMIFDPQVGVNIAVLGPASVAFSNNSAGVITINTGSATVVNDPAFNAMTNISGGTTSALIGKFKVHAYGEDVKVNSLTITPTFVGQTTTGTAAAYSTGSQNLTVGSTTGFGAGNIFTITGAGGTVATGTVTSITSATIMVVNITAAGTPTGATTVAVTTEGLNNVTLYFNGAQVGTQQVWPVAGGSLTYNLGSQLIAPAGVDSWLEVRADLQSVASVSYVGGTVGVNLVLGSANAQGQNSLATLNFPTALVVGHTLTIQTGLLTVSTNTAYLSQSVSPNTAGVKLGSFIASNQSTSESVRLTSLTVALTGTEAITNISGLRTSVTSGSGATPIQPAASNVFSVNETLAPGASKVIDIFADSSTQTGVNEIVVLTVASVGVTSNVSSAGTAVTGQTITFNTGTVNTTPTLVTASSTTAQYVAAGNGGATNATKATYNFVSTSGAATVSELKFTVTGANTVTNVCVTGMLATGVTGTQCAAPGTGGTGVAYLTGLALPVSNGGSGLTQDVLVSYSEVGTNGIAPNFNSSIALTYVKYTSGGTTTSFTPNISAPTMAMVGSKPAVSVPNTSNAGLIIGTENKIGEVTVAADAKGNIKINDIQFAVGSANFGTMPTFSAARIADGSTTVIGSSCGQGTAVQASQTIFCEFGTVGDTIAVTTLNSNVESNTDYDGYTIAAGTSKTFNLYASFTGAATAGSTQTIATSVVATGFNWDDTSSATFVANGSPSTGTAATGATASSATVNAGTNGTNLDGARIYNFPTSSYSIHN